MALTNDDIAFLRGDRLSTLITTGCNIPIFVAAHAQELIIPFNKPNAGFSWLNYYDKDDVLGWPLADLSEPYAALVSDIEVNVTGGFWGWLAASWNPLSHNLYWQDKQIQQAICGQLANIAKLVSGKHKFFSKFLPKKKQSHQALLVRLRNSLLSASTT